MSTHFFDTDIACEYGMCEAVIFQNLVYWIEKNEANERHFYDGRYWTYNSVKAFGNLFPYLSKKKIANALVHLEEEGLIVTGNYNKSAYDRTKWYGLTDKGKRLLQKVNSISPFGIMEEPEKENGFTENGKPIPDNNTYNKQTNKNTDNKTSKDTRTLFDTLCGNYNISDFLLTKVSEWITYKVERKEGYKEQGMKSLLKQIEKNANQYGDMAVSDLIDECMGNNWKGIIWDRIKRHTTTSGNAPNRLDVVDSWLERAIE